MITNDTIIYKQYTQENFKNDFTTYLEDLKALFPELNTKIYHLGFLSSEKRALGCCGARKSYYFIQLNPVFASVCPKEEVKTTIYHEILHSLDGCMNHSPKWKNAANIVNNFYGTHITTLHNKKGLEKYYELNPAFKYEIVCPNCGILSHYMRASNSVKALQNGQTNFYCTKCKSHELKLVTR